jgi:predicted nucleotide-binding protein (sugar kinase/HSP70/actin superfamily)
MFTLISKGLKIIFINCVLSIKSRNVYTNHHHHQQPRWTQKNHRERRESNLAGV